MGLAKRIANKLIDAVLGTMGKLLGGAFDWIVGKLAGAVGLLVTPVGELMVFTPAPRPIGQLGQRPTNSPWGSLYDAFWADMVPLGMLLLLVSYLVRQAAASFGIGSVAAQRQTQRGVIVGLILIPSSWYLSSFLLQLFDALTRALAPNMTNLSGILNQVAVSGNGLSAIFASILMLIVGGSVYALVLVLNVVRIAGTFTLVYGLPLLIAFDLGRFPYVGDISRRLLGLLPTLAFMPLPTAVGLRLSLIVFGQNGGLTIDGLPASPLLNAVFLLAPGLLGIAIPFIVLRSSQFGQRLRPSRTLSTNANPNRARSAASGFSPRDRRGSVRNRFSRRSADDNDDDSPSTTTETASTDTVSSEQTGGLPTRQPSGHGHPALPSANGNRVSTDGRGRYGHRSQGRHSTAHRPSFIATGDGYVVETSSRDESAPPPEKSTATDSLSDYPDTAVSEPGSAENGVAPPSRATDATRAPSQHDDRTDDTKTDQTDPTASEPPTDDTIATGPSNDDAETTDTDS